MPSLACRRAPVVALRKTPQQKAREQFAELERWLFAKPALEATLDEVEREQERRSREIQRLLLQAHLDERKGGDVGRAIAVVTEDESGETTTRRHGEHRHHTRKIHSLFGEVDARRTAYFATGAESVHPLDEQAALPERTFSYELQRRGIVGAVQGPFDEAVERIKESTGTVLSKRSVEQIVRDGATDFDDFYAVHAPPAAAETGPIVVAAVDGKGVPMVKPEEALRVVRRGKGEKANKKRMATVACVFTQEPRVRTPEEVVESLFREGPRVVLREGETPRQWAGPEHKRLWASLAKEKDEVIAEVSREVAARDPGEAKTLVLVMDGERALQNRAAKAMPRGVEILDLLHAVEKLWKGAYCFHAEASAGAKEWVRERVLRLLRGGVSQVVKGIRSSATKQGLDAKRRKIVKDATGYFYNNRRRMRYDEYLRRGLPIASGSVEGACKNLIADRMERSGMRWTIETAESMLRLRAIYLSGDFEAYWSFHMSSEQERLHPSGLWRVTEG